MKKKIYFIASSIMLIILNLLAICNAHELTNRIIESMGTYPENLQERVNALFTNSGPIYILVMALIGIVLNCFTIYWAYTDKLVKQKGKIIGSAIFHLLTAFYSLTDLLAIVNIIVITTGKKEDNKDYSKEKKEMPKLKKEKVTKDKIILAVILLAVYFSQFLWNSWIPEKGLWPIVTATGFYILMMILSIVFFMELLNDNFKIFKKNFKAYFQNLIGKIGKFYLIYFGVVIFSVLVFKTDTSANQEIIESIPLWYSIPLAILYAPLVEEVLFRGCIRRFIKDDKIFIIVSALVFGLIHTVFAETTLVQMFTNAIPYITLGGFLAYLYVKTNNICTNMAFHAFVNTLAVVLMILMKGV